jgi:hypothetical protein
MNKFQINSNAHMKVNWIDIINIPEFYKLLNLDNLKQVSLISKAARLKLKPKLFEFIEFNGDKFHDYFENSENLLCEYFNFVQLSMDSEENQLNGYCYKDLDTGLAIKEIEDQLIKLKLLAKSFYFIDVNRVGYYLFPLVSVFDNLTVLALYNCTVPLVKFYEIVNSLPKLEGLELESTLFAKLNTEEYAIDCIKFPKTLKKLAIFDCSILSSELLSNSYNFLLDKANSGTYTDFKLPPNQIPSLYKFTYLPESFTESGFNDFLLNNPQLEIISFNSFSLNQASINNFTNFHYLRRLEVVCSLDKLSKLNVLPLNSIKELELFSINQLVYPVIQDICLNSPNLTKLTFKFDSIREFFPVLTNALDYIISNCSNLKLFKFSIIRTFKELINLEKLGSVEVLVIESTLETIQNIQFENATNLKKVYFYYNDFEVNNEFKTKFLEIKGWKFWFKDGCIKGNKL